MDDKGKPRKSMESESESLEDFDHGDAMEESVEEESDYYDDVSDSDSDSEGLYRDGVYHTVTYDFEKDPLEVCPYPSMVKVFALAGIHRYNLLNESDWKLHHLKKVSVTLRAMIISPFHINLLATSEENKATATFQVFVSQHSFYALNVSVDDKPEIDCNPPQIDLKDIGGPFCVLERSEWDWVYLYLQLVVCAADRRISQTLLSSLNIVEVEVAIGTDEVVPLPHKAKHATLRIKYKGWDAVCRTALVTREFNKTTGVLSIAGESGIPQEAVTAKYAHQVGVGILSGSSDPTRSRSEKIRFGSD